MMSVINLNYIKDYKNWSISDFAREYGISPQGASVYFKKRQLPIEFAVKVCEDFGISLDYIYRFKLTREVIEAKDPYFIQPKKEPVTAEPAGTYEAGNSHIDKVAQIKGLMEVFEHDPDLSERFNKELLDIGELFIEQLQVEKENIKNEINKAKKKATA